MHKELRPEQIDILVGSPAVNDEFSKKVRELDRRLQMNGMSYRDWDILNDRQHDIFTDNLFLDGECASSAENYVKGAVASCGCPDTEEELHHHSPVLMGEIEKQEDMLPDVTVKIGESLSNLNGLIDNLLEEQLLLEGSGRGVQLEWATVYWALEESVSAEVLAQRIEAAPKLELYGSGEMQGDAKECVALLKKAGVDLSKAQHSDEAKIEGDPEPKTDIIFGNNIRVSVKMTGVIQLTSSQGKRTALMFKTVRDELLSDPAWADKLEQNILEDIVKRVESIPTKMIDPKNLAKALARKFKQATAMMKNGSLLDDKNWKIWEENNKIRISADVVSFCTNNEEFHYRLIEEAATGKRVFGPNNLATANYILTPRYYGPIDKNYILKMMKKTKIQIRAKSRSGITAATMRFDLSDAAEVAAEAQQVRSESPTEEMLQEGIKDIIGKWWKKLKGVVIGWYTKNIERIARGAMQDLEVTIESEDS